VRWPWSKSRREPEAEEIAGSGHARADGSALHSRSADGGSLRLVKVAYARNLAEAELIEGLLRGNGIPSMTQRNGGFDVPDFLAAGPRDVLVPEHEAARARELLGEEHT
jgi:putative signal transducing protein